MEVKPLEMGIGQEKQQIFDEGYERGFTDGYYAALESVKQQLSELQMKYKS